jgi:hypothetical protein
MLLRAFVMIAALMATAAIADDWEPATLVKEQSTSDSRYQRCTYETFGGLRFTILYEGTECPLSIQVNPSKGSWKK